MSWTLPVVAGTVSTVVFAASTLPMLRKAARTRDMDSYSRGNLVLSNVGNVVHTLYVLSLPPGPIWALHGFYLATAAVMLVWHVRHAGRAPGRSSTPAPNHAAAAPGGMGGLPEAIPARSFVRSEPPLTGAHATRRSAAWRPRTQARPRSSRTSTRSSSGVARRACPSGTTWRGSDRTS